MSWLGRDFLMLSTTAFLELTGFSHRSLRLRLRWQSRCAFPKLTSFCTGRKGFASGFWRLVPWDDAVPDRQAGGSVPSLGSGLTCKALDTALIQTTWPLSAPCVNGYIPSKKNSGMHSWLYFLFVFSRRTGALVLVVSAPARLWSSRFPRDAVPGFQPRVRASTGVKSDICWPVVVYLG